MRIKGLLLAAATLYQLLRFTMLFFSVILVLQDTAAAGAASIVLALGAPSLVVILLLLQLGFSLDGKVLKPLRTTALIQILTALALFINTLQAPLPLYPRIPAMILLGASIMVITDVAFLFFLLIYGRTLEES